MKINLNEAAMRAMAEGIAKKISGVDARFRRQHEGKPVAEVKPRVKSAFGAIGLTMTSAQIDDYASAVSQRKPYNWVIR